MSDLNSNEPARAANPAGKKPAVLRGCPNQTSQEMTVCEPWLYRPDIPEAARVDKTAFKKWSVATSTQHLFYTASEGVNPNFRISQLNPLRVLHGLISDYDCTHADAEMLTKSLGKQLGENLPNWSSLTYSGGVRLVWLFERPLPLENANLARHFFSVAAAELRLTKLLPGLDEGAWSRPEQIYEVGNDWTPISASPLPAARLYAMQEKASRKVKWPREGVNIPLELVADEMERQFPGRWDGAFEVGARGCAFFDEASTNPSAAIVKETGLVCFSQPKSFYSWEEILGSEFVRQYKEDRIGQAASDAWYDGKSYWLKSDGGIWQSLSGADFVIRAKVQHRIHAKTPQGDSCSEMDRLLSFIHEHRRVDGAMPRIFCEDDILTENGRRFVNCSAVKVMQPADVKQEWGEDFPWLANFFDTCWDEAPVPCVKPEIPAAPAKDIFHAWLRRYYVSARQGQPEKGHALFLVGPVDTGKTLLGTGIVAELMGGGSDAADFLINKASFNKELVQVGVWNIDDGRLGSDPQAHQQFSEMIKRVVANSTQSYHPKYQDAMRTEWNGRVVVTLNDDGRSITMIPSLDSNLEDKLIVLKLSDKPRSFPSRAKLKAILAKELPYFLRWLIDWQIPEALVGGSRFGIHAFIHEDTRVAALHSGGVGDLLELVAEWIRLAVPEGSYGKVWEGTATGWMTLIEANEILRPFIRKHTARSLGRKFTDASKIRGSGIEVVPSRSHSKGNRYRIRLDRPTEESQGLTARYKFTDIASELGVGGFGSPNNADGLQVANL